MKFVPRSVYREAKTSTLVSFAGFQFRLTRYRSVLAPAMPPDPFPTNTPPKFGAIETGEVGGQDPLDVDRPLPAFGFQVQDKPLGIESVMIPDLIVRVGQVIVVKPPDAEVAVHIQLHGP